MATNGLSPDEIGRMKPHADSSIFSMFPAAASAEELSTLKSGATGSSVYHNYHSETLVIWGHADPAVVQQKIKGPWQPVLTPEGRACASLWAIEYKHTTVNPYKELVFVLMVTHKSQEPLVVNSAFERLQKYDDKEAYPYIYKLWLDESLPVDFGRELLGCDKYHDKGMILEFTKAGCASRAECEFEFHHTQGEVNSPAAGLLMKGKLSLADGMGLGGLFGAYGVGRTMGMSMGAQANWHLINAPGVIEKDSMHHAAEGCEPDNCNPVWDMYYETSPKFSYAAAEDQIEFGGEPKEMGFTPELYQHDTDFKAVLLAPWHYERLDNDQGPRPQKPADMQAPASSGTGCRSCDAADRSCVAH